MKTFKTSPIIIRQIYDGALFLILFFIIVILFLVLKIGWFFTYFEFMKLLSITQIDSFQYLLSITLFSLSILIASTSFLLIKKIKNDVPIQKQLLFMVFLGLTYVIAFNTVTVALVFPATNSVDNFIASYSSYSLPEYLDKISIFITTNIVYTQSGPLKIDDMLLRVNLVDISLDYPFLAIFGITRGDLIVYQQYGSCGENAILTQELLTPTGYETRLAKYIDQDHLWCEMYFQNQWQIIDIGHGFLGKLQSLNNSKTYSTSATGVLVLLSNGTWIDDSFAHDFN